MRGPCSAETRVRGAATSVLLSFNDGRIHRDRRPESRLARHAVNKSTVFLLLLPAHVHGGCFEATSDGTQGEGGDLFPRLTRTMVPFADGRHGSINSGSRGRGDGRICLGTLSRRSRRFRIPSKAGVLVRGTVFITNVHKTCYAKLSRS